jgi:hypothetical protein
VASFVLAEPVLGMGFDPSGTLVIAGAGSVSRVDRREPRVERIGGFARHFGWVWPRAGILPRAGLVIHPLNESPAVVGDWRDGESMEMDRWAPQVVTATGRSSSWLGVTVSHTEEAIAVGTKVSGALVIHLVAGRPARCVLMNQGLPRARAPLHAFHPVDGVVVLATIGGDLLAHDVETGEMVWSRRKVYYGGYPWE